MYRVFFALCQLFSLNVSIVLLSNKVLSESKVFINNGSKLLILYFV